MKAWLAALLALTALVDSGSVLAATQGHFEGRANRIIDGDTLTVRAIKGGHLHTLRLVGIDAPEACQAWGRESRAALAARLEDQALQVRTQGRDAYRRQLARVGTLRDPDIASWMVMQGHAWSWHEKGRGGRYAFEEAQARAAHRGLWASPQAIEPRVFRRSHGPCH